MKSGQGDDLLWLLFYLTWDSYLFRIDRQILQLPYMIGYLLFVYGRQKKRHGFYPCPDLQIKVDCSAHCILAIANLQFVCIPFEGVFY